MSRAEQAQELFELLFRELSQRLGPGGWQPMDAPDADSFDFAFIKRLRGDFAATCAVVRAAPDEVPISIVAVLIGVSYEPLRNLSSLLGGRFRLSVLHTSATDDEAMKLVDETDWDKADDDGAEDIEPDLFQIGSRSEVPAVAQAISDLAMDRAVPFAERRADLDVLIRQLADPTIPNSSTSECRRCSQRQVGSTRRVQPSIGGSRLLNSWSSASSAPLSSSDVGSTLAATLRPRRSHLRDKRLPLGPEGASPPLLGWARYNTLPRTDRDLVSRRERHVWPGKHAPCNARQGGRCRLHWRRPFLVALLARSETSSPGRAETWFRSGAVLPLRRRGAVRLPAKRSAAARPSRHSRSRSSTWPNARNALVTAVIRERRLA